MARKKVTIEQLQEEAKAAEEEGQDRVYWEDHEWEKLADLMYRMRLNNLRDTWTALFTKAVQQLPKDRHRRPAKSALEKLEELVGDKITKLKKDIHEIQSLRDRLAATEKFPSKKEILDSMTQVEIEARFKPRILQSLSFEDVLKVIPNPEDFLVEIPTPRLAGVALSRLLEMFEPVSTPTLEKAKIPFKKGITIQETLGGEKLPDEAPPKPKPHIALAGFKREQFALVKRAVSDMARLYFVPKERKQDLFPASLDAVVIFVSKTGHMTTDYTSELKAKGVVILDYVRGLTKAVRVIESFSKAFMMK